MKKPINEIKKMQRLAGLITESEYQESLMNENMTLDPIKLKALVRALKTHGGFIGDRQSYKEIADLLSSNQLAKAANTIVNLDTSPNEMVYDMIKSTYPELWDMLFDNEEDDYIAAARPKAGLPESSINEAKDIPSILRKWDAAPGDRLDYQTVANMIEVGRIEAAAKFITDELDTSIREMMMDIIEENDPALFNKMFSAAGYKADASKFVRSNDLDPYAAAFRVSQGEDYDELAKQFSNLQDPKVKALVMSRVKKYL